MPLLFRPLRERKGAFGIGTGENGYTASEVESMLKYVVGAVCIGTAFVLYCCCRVAAEADRQMEALYRQEMRRLRGEQDAD